jgi:hypothetical protein
MLKQNSITTKFNPVKVETVQVLQELIIPTGFARL